MEKTELKILLNHGTVLAEAFFRFVSYRLESYAGNVSKCGKSESRNRASTRLAHSFFLAALLGLFPLLYCSLTCTAFNSLFLRGWCYLPPMDSNAISERYWIDSELKLKALIFVQKGPWFIKWDRWHFTFLSTVDKSDILSCQRNLALAWAPPKKGVNRKLRRISGTLKKLTRNHNDKTDDLQ